MPIAPPTRRQSHQSSSCSYFRQGTEDNEEIYEGICKEEIQERYGIEEITGRGGLRRKVVRPTQQEHGGGGTWREMNEALPSISLREQQKLCPKAREECIKILPRKETTEPNHREKDHQAPYERRESSTDLLSRRPIKTDPLQNGPSSWMQRRKTPR